MDNFRSTNGMHPHGDHAEEMLETIIADLQAERHPTLPEIIEPEDAELVQMAALLHGTLAVDATPSSDFARSLQARLERELFPPRSQTPPAAPTTTPKRGGTSRRGMLRTGLVAAAGLAAGVVGGAIIAHQPNEEGGSQPPWPPIVGEGGIWLAVAEMANIVPGTALRFATPNLVGYLLRYQDGTITAFSAACTHMGCITNWNANQHTFDCPCHNGRFDDHGQAITNPAIYRPLPKILTRVNGAQIEVFVPQAASPDANAFPTPTGDGYQH